MPTDLLALSWSVQIAVTSGYAAYIIAYRGIRSHHTAQDTVFLSLVFSLIASGVLWLARDIPPPLASAWAFIACIAAGLIWRWYGMKLLGNTLRDLDTTWADDTPSAWVRLQDNNEYPVSQLSVLLKDGTWLHCEETAKFNELPYSPCILGTSGDVLMYLTSLKEKGAPESRAQTSVIDPAFGARLTYIPSGEIARINIRLLPSINRPQMEAASPAASSKGPLAACLHRCRRGLASVLRKVAEAIS